jgi:hypothetical protein
VQLAEAAAARELSSWGWAFREQAAYDLGIDALAEEVDDGLLTGRVMALVFKGGQAVFAELANRNIPPTSVTRAANHGR